MSITSGFEGREALAEEVPDCPLRHPERQPHQNACARCAYNRAHPGNAVIGCFVRTPYPVYEAALKGLAERAPDDRRELDLLLTGNQSLGSQNAEAAKRWLDLAQRWFAALPPEGDDAEREVAIIIARFARAYLETRKPVQLLA